MSYLIHLEKENFKFSCTHFTIFSPKHAERMHGHNYRLRVGVRSNRIDRQLGMPFDFNLIKPKIQQICDELDEYILIPTQSPYLQVAESEHEVQATFDTKKYTLPKTDVRLLPLVNITAEELARFVFERLKAQCQLPAVEALEVTVEETAGQSVTYFE